MKSTNRYGTERANEDVSRLHSMGHSLVRLGEDYEKYRGVGPAVFNYDADLESVPLRRGRWVLLTER